jgi:hypothetical protein
MKIENLNRQDWDEVEETVKQAIKSAKLASKTRPMATEGEQS